MFIYEVTYCYEALDGLFSFYDTNTETIEANSEDDAINKLIEEYDDEYDVIDIKKVGTVQE